MCQCGGLCSWRGRPRSCLRPAPAEGRTLQLTIRPQAARPLHSVPNESPVGAKATAFILKAGETKPMVADGGVSLSSPPGAQPSVAQIWETSPSSTGQENVPDGDSVASCEGGDLQRSVQGLGGEPTRDLREKGFYSQLVSIFLSRNQR